MNYKRFFDISVDMLCIANTEGYFVEINDAFSRILGYSKSTLLSENLLTYIHPNDIAKTKNELNKLNEGNVSLDFENRYKHKDGHYLNFSWSSQIDHEDGLIYAIARDVTDQSAAKHKANKIEQALISSTILAETDRNGVILAVNDNFCAISGYSREEIVGKTHNIVNSGFHPRSFFTEMWRTITNKSVWSGVVKNKNKNGTFYYVQTVITPVTDHDGNISTFLAIRQDITESVQHKEALDRTLEILKQTSEIAKVGGWELAVETGELTWTDETFRILEVEKNDDRKPILPEGIELFVPEHQAIIEEAINRAIEFSEPYSQEVQAQTEKGNVLWVLTTGQANIIDGKVVSLSGTIQDIDTRKKTELKYDIEKQKSIQSAKLASLGELAASMAHEINNPLGIISGYTELMLSSKDVTANSFSKLETVLKSCDRISHIVNNLKKFSRVDDVVDHSPHELSVVISEAISLAETRLKREFVTLRLLDHQVTMVNCNAIEIEQVILNLINNSIDGIKNKEEKWIDISLNDTGENIECRVVDSGKGISDSIQAKIFNPFFTSKKAGEGTGLGLSVVKDILSDHGASIEYDDTSPNTCFILNFPKAQGI